VIDQKMDRVIFIVNPGEMGLAIGRGGSTIEKMQRAIAKTVEPVEWSDDPKQFIVNCLNRNYVKDIRMSEKSDGTKSATVVVDQAKKGAVLGKAGRNAEKARLLARRHYSVETIHIVTPQ